MKYVDAIDEAGITLSLPARGVRVEILISDGESVIFDVTPRKGSAG